MYLSLGRYYVQNHELSVMKITVSPIVRNMLAHYKTVLQLSHQFHIQSIEGSIIPPVQEGKYKLRLARVRG